MVKVLLLGASGMLGHRIFLELSKTMSVVGTSRADLPELENFSLEKGELITGIDATDATSLHKIFAQVQPQFVINCVGAIKQKKAISPVEMIELNSIIPWRLADLCREFSAQMIHFSTDCVFSGVDGDYSEQSTPDASDVYGRSKLLGEVGDQSDVLTLRTSIIGREIRSGLSLVEWFLAQRQKQKINGFRQAIYTGFPTQTVAKIVRQLISADRLPGGLYHLSSTAIDKFSLLKIIKDKLELEVEIEAIDEPKIDRSLNSQKFRKKVNFPIPSEWSELVGDLLVDFDKYEALRKQR